MMQRNTYRLVPWRHQWAGNRPSTRGSACPCVDHAGPRSGLRTRREHVYHQQQPQTARCGRVCRQLVARVTARAGVICRMRSPTTFNARTYLQPRQKAARADEKESKGDKNPRISSSSPRRTSKCLRRQGQHGREAIHRGHGLPTLKFPSDHGVVSQSSRSKADGRLPCAQPYSRLVAQLF